MAAFCATGLIAPLGSHLRLQTITSLPAFALPLCMSPDEAMIPSRPLRSEGYPPPELFPLYRMLAQKAECFLYLLMLYLGEKDF